MDETIDYSNFRMPADFQTTNKFKSVSSDVNGISRFDYGEGLVPWRFALSPRPWKAEKVKQYRIEGSDTIPVIMFYRDKDNHLPMKLRRKVKYEERRDRYGDAFDKAIPLVMEDLNTMGSGFYVEGATEMDLWELPTAFSDEIFQVAFEKWKEKGAQKGTPLAAWRADPGMVQTLANLGIYAVEQFGQLSEAMVQEQILTKVPPGQHGTVKELHEMAIIFVESQAGLSDAKIAGDKLQVVQDANEKLQEELEAKEEEIERLLEKVRGTAKPAPKKRGRSKKAVKVKDGVIEGDENEAA